MGVQIGWFGVVTRDKVGEKMSRRKAICRKMLPGNRDVGIGERVPYSTGP